VWFWGGGGRSVVCVLWLGWGCECWGGGLGWFGGLGGWVGVENKDLGRLRRRNPPRYTTGGTAAKKKLNICCASSRKKKL